MIAFIEIAKSRVGSAVRAVQRLNRRSIPFSSSSLCSWVNLLLVDLIKGSYFITVESYHGFVIAYLRAVALCLKFVCSFHRVGKPVISPDVLPLPFSWKFWTRRIFQSPILTELFGNIPFIYHRVVGIFLYEKRVIEDLCQFSLRVIGDSTVFLLSITVLVEALPLLDSFDLINHVKVVVLLL